MVTRVAVSAGTQVPNSGSASTAPHPVGYLFPNFEAGVQLYYSSSVFFDHNMACVFGVRTTNVFWVYVRQRVLVNILARSISRSLLILPVHPVPVPSPVLSIPSNQQRTSRVDLPA